MNILILKGINTPYIDFNLLFLERKIRSRKLKLKLMMIKCRLELYFEIELSK